MKDEYSSQIKSLCNTRDRLVKLRTSLKNKIHNILLAHGIITKREDFSSEKGLKKAQSYALGEIAEVELDVIVAQIRHLNEGIKKLDQEIKSRGKRLKGYKNITSIKDSYFGIVPRVRDSNNRIRYSPYLRDFYLQLKNKKGSGKAIIATSRKLLGIIYLTLKNNWIFEDFPNFVLQS